MALAPLGAYLTGGGANREALFVNTFENSQAAFKVGTARVKVAQRSGFPVTGASELEFSCSKAARFVVRVRVPAWGGPLEMAINGKSTPARVQDGWAELPARKWKTGDRVALRFALEPRLVIGQHTNAGLAALEWGPFVMAYDAAENPDFQKDARLQFGNSRAGTRVVTANPLEVKCPVRSPGSEGDKPAVFVPFADAGLNKEFFKVWLAAPQ